MIGHAWPWYLGQPPQNATEVLWRWRSRKVGKGNPLRPRKLGHHSSTLESQIFNDKPQIHLEIASFKGNFGYICKEKIFAGGGGPGPCLRK